MKEEILKFIFKIAMRDATLQKSYIGNKKELTEIDNLEETKKCLTSFLNNIVLGNIKNKDDYNKKFLKLTHIMCDEINKIAKNKEFTFGNAQKLINIMTKYLYIITYNNEDIRDNFKYCHCPMDSILLEDVWKKRKELKNETLKKLKDRKFFLQSWGNEDFKDDEFPERYNAFQDAIKELSEKVGLNSIEYDYHNWK